jgi:hypothetical protein
MSLPKGMAKMVAEDYMREKDRNPSDQGAPEDTDDPPF